MYGTDPCAMRIAVRIAASGVRTRVPISGTISRWRSSSLTGTGMQKPRLCRRCPSRPCLGGCTTWTPILNSRRMTAGSSIQRLCAAGWTWHWPPFLSSVTWQNNDKTIQLDAQLDPQGLHPFGQVSSTLATLREPLCFWTSQRITTKHKPLSRLN